MTKKEEDRNELLNAHIDMQGPHNHSMYFLSDRYKFRAWNGKEMVEVNLISLDDEKVADYYNFYDGYAGEWININDRIPLMQYTGTNDKNGTPVYEGDIVKVFGWAKCIYHTVIFSSPSFCIELEGSRSLLPFGVNMEVVGNIFNLPK